jgi:hypothetical protein
MSTITIKRGDRLPVIARQFLVDDVAIDLTGATITFQMWNAATGTQVVTDGVCTIVTAATGQVEFPWTSTTAALPAGQYLAVFRASFAGPRLLTAPNNGLMAIHILAETESVWSYTGNPASRDIDHVRFLAGDTDSANQLSNDAEITFLLDQWNNDYYYAAASVLEHAANRYAAKADYSKSVGDMSISTQYKALAESLNARAKTLRDQAQMHESAPSPRVSSTAIGDFKFSIDMDNWI